jgi:3'-phosphoadenosine 5'-phosphosulfate sulfotransferase (PAPS reductase)/FAD synthetase
MIDTALQYSGGKDSRAILHMYKDKLDKIVVVWADTGASYPEVQAEMRQMCRKVPHFLIVKGNQPKQVAANGFPSDVVPINYSPFGRAMVKSDHGFKMQSAFDCCNANMWQPLHTAMKMLGIKRIIRGQRKDERYTNSAIKSGTVLDGIEFVLPLDDWTSDEVLAYLRGNNVPVPDYYKTEGTSHDCWNCTAYLSSYTQRIQNLPAPQRAEVNSRLQLIDAAISAETQPLKALLKAA